jgi:methylglutaconyl-CoA hydratase
MKLVETAFANGVMTITLADEKRRNALSDEMVAQLVAAINFVEDDPDVRVAVVTNRGHVFCAGINLAERVTKTSTGGEQSTASLSDLFQRIRDCPKPFVGRIAGHCVAGGVGLAAVMDISVAIETATFGFSEVRLGVVPAVISVVCLPKMRLGDAQSAFLRGNRFSADEAARFGLINSAVGEQDLEREVTAIVNDLLAGEPHAIGVAKQLATMVGSMKDEEAYAWTTELSARLFSSDEAHEGMAAFLEKRSATWVLRGEGDDPS